jgi:excisionase family DNA binding protein
MRRLVFVDARAPSSARPATSAHRAAAVAVEVQIASRVESLVTRATVAHWLNVSQATVDREVRDGALVQVRVRRMVRFRPEDVRRYLAESAQRDGHHPGTEGRDSKPE